MKTDTMTADEAQRLLDGATPGEWGAYRPYEYPKDFRLASLQGPPVRYVGRLTRSHPNEPHPTKGDAALCAAAPRLAASVVALHAHLAQVTAERDALRAIVEGRTTPPSDEELAAHDGPWLVVLDHSAGHAARVVRGLDAQQHADRQRELRRAWVWHPVDERDGAIVAWPVVDR